MPSASRPTSRLEGIMEAPKSAKDKLKEDTIIVEKPDEACKRSNLDELDKIYEAIKSMKLTAQVRGEMADRLLTVINKMKSEQAKEEPKPKQTQFEQIMDMYQDIMKGVNEVNIAINTTTKTVTEAMAKQDKTYAQAAATPPIEQRKTFINPARKQELEKAKKERKQYELSINLKNSPQQTLELIRNTHAKDITASFQKVINNSSKHDDKPTVVGISRIGITMIRLQFHTKDGAQRAREIDAKWDDAYKGAESHKPNYGIVVHGVPHNAINFEDDFTEIIKEWEEENASIDIKITRATPLRRNGKQGKPAMHKSIIIFTQDPEAADRCLQRGFMIQKQRMPKVEKYAPHLHMNQCFKCQKFGHRSTFCKLMNKCGKCGSEEYATPECKATEPQCANCGGPHEAWHLGCTKRDEEAQRLYQLKREAPAFFTL